MTHNNTDIICHTSANLENGGVERGEDNDRKWTDALGKSKNNYSRRHAA